MLNSKMKADLIIKNAKVIDIFQNRIIDGNIAIKDGLFIGVGDYEDGDKIIDAKGNYVSPTMTDGHVHIESSMVSPAEFLKCLVARGVSTIIADPHEITNVCGLDGIKYIIDEVKDLPVNVYIMLPSCVPATPFETSGAILKAKDYDEIIKDKHILGLGELMDFVGTVNRDKDIMDKIKLAKDNNMVIDGHAPMLSGKALDDYVLAGVNTDHECSTVEEMQEKIQRGMYIQLREGTAANNVRKAIKLGMEPLNALKMATINPVECYKLEKLGAIAPGYKADFFIFEDLEDIQAKEVFLSGEKIAENGKTIVDFPQKLSSKVLSKMKVNEVSSKDLNLKLNKNKVNIIQMQKDSLLTKKVVREVEIEDNHFKYSDDDIKKIAVIEKHTGKSTIAIGLIEGYDIKNGAIGTTIAHDSHNMIVIGDNDDDMVCVINKIREMGGGMAISSNSEIIDCLKLDIAGIMSSDSIEDVEKNMKRLLKNARKLGIKEGIDPFMTMGFMALPVIPEIKITDKGLFDVNNFKYIDIEA